MSKKEGIFKELIDAFNHFLDVDEKEIGCLTEKEHERMCNDVNYYSDLFIRKTKKKIRRPQESKKLEITLLNDENDEDNSMEMDKDLLHKVGLEM